MVDLYVWFRWKGPELDPSKTMEFMNRYASDDNVREALYEQPKEMPDGSLYSIVRYQGRFAAKFPLEKYPFDTQLLTVAMEDTVSGAAKAGLCARRRDTGDAQPGDHLAGVHGRQTQHANHRQRSIRPISAIFRCREAEAYSRIVVTVPVTRPVVAMSLKTFVPITLIVVCAALVFFVRPRYVEGRMALGITALLTLVALQLASGSSLPDVDYLMMLDKIYLLAYLFIILALARVVATSWHGHDDHAEKAISRGDRIWVVALLAAYFIANVAVAWTTLA